MLLEVEYFQEKKKGKRLRILTPKQMLQRLITNSSCPSKSS